MLDNLIHRLEIPPMIVALTNSPDRLNEYAADQRHAEVPGRRTGARRWSERYPLIDRPEARALMGASFRRRGGAVHGLAPPRFFGGLLLQSGSFAFSDIGRARARAGVRSGGGVRQRVPRGIPGTPADKVFVSCGIYESLIYENRSLVPLLQATRMDLRYVEARDGHNWENWRDRLREGSPGCSPGPLWMVYE